MKHTHDKFSYTHLILGLYFAFLLCLAPINILSFDTYYYWDWSRHLALSYYDGSPMIAYFIKLSTLIWGNSLFALSCIGITVAGLTSGIIYKTARFFLSKEASCIALCSWLFSPLVTLDILKQTTYDTPLTLFWALTLYYTVKFIHTHKTKELYFIGVSMGLMMLSKYTGIVLILSLFIFLIFSPYRSLFKTKHLYFAIFLSLILFSPVILWNFQNHWQSFLYQLNSHKLNHSINPASNTLKTFFTLFIPSLNIMLLLPLLCSFSLAMGQQQEAFGKKPLDKTALTLKLCCIVCVTFFCFYLGVASKTQLREFWLAPYLISAALLFGYCFQKFNHHPLFVVCIILYALISLIIYIDNTSKYNLISSKKNVFYRLVEQFNATYTPLPETIFTSGWFQARMLFFLKNKPNIYTLGCGTAQNQYALWSARVAQQITDKSLKEAFFIDKYDRISCLKHYFEHCKKIPTNTYRFHDKEYALNVYQCHNL